MAIFVSWFKIKWLNYTKLVSLVSQIFLLLTTLALATCTCTRTGALAGNQADTPLPKLGEGFSIPGLFSLKYGVEVFDLTADQICSLLENPDTDQCKIWHSCSLGSVRVLGLGLG